MSNFFTIILILLPFIAYSQFTMIPDSNFEQSLVNQGIDSDGVVNGQVLTSDVASLSALSVHGQGIVNITGIEDFVNLITLDVGQNMITEIDLSNLLLLEELYCGSIDFDVGPINDITTLDVSNNYNLRVLSCAFNLNLTGLDISNNPNLEYLEAIYCDLTAIDVSYNAQLETLILGAFFGDIEQPSNNLTSLDVSNNPNLALLGVFRTNLSSLDVKNGNNDLLIELFASENPDLFCIQVDDEIAANNGDAPYDSWAIDSWTSYSEDCTFGIDDVIATPVILYPNPAKEIIFLETHKDALIQSITIYDISGKVMAVFEPNPFELVGYDIHFLKNGLYILHIEVNSNRYTYKVLKK